MHRNIIWGCLLGTIAVGICSLALGGPATAADTSGATPPYLSEFPNFAPTIAPELPGDVDAALKKMLEHKSEDKSRFAEEQRLFDLYAWQMFLALNWPTDTRGQPAPSLTDTRFGPPHWTLWRDSEEIFRVDGKRPAACDKSASERRLSLAREPGPVMRGLPAPPKLAAGTVDERKVRTLANVSAVGELSIAQLAKLTETGQAFSGPLVDQNRNLVHYEILVDPNEVDFLCENKLYNLNGQIAYSQKSPVQPPKVEFPVGTSAKDWSGAIELKLAWKILDKDKGDQPGRFYATQARIPTLAAGTGPIEWKTVTVGLVGMHIAHKTASSPQWIWATFEQIDNLVGDALAHPPAHPPVKASFFDPDCENCLPNLQPPSSSVPTIPVQVMRAIPIPGEKLSLNARAQAVLGKMGSVWQYYQLIDTQWPTDPTAKPASWNCGLPEADPKNCGFPAAVNNKSGGKPTPVLLTNVTMETFFQKGLQPACQQEELPDGIPCPPQPGMLSGDGTPIFTSESCMGCHSSAGLAKEWDANTNRATFWSQLSGDFSWLLQQKASYDPTTPIPLRQ